MLGIKMNVFGRDWIPQTTYDIHFRVNTRYVGEGWEWRRPMTVYQGVVYIEDHEVVPRPCNICDWLLNSA